MNILNDYFIKLRTANFLENFKSFPDGVIIRQNNSGDNHSFLTLLHKYFNENSISYNLISDEKENISIEAYCTENGESVFFSLHFYYSADYSNYRYSFHFENYISNRPNFNCLHWAVSSPNILKMLLQKLKEVCHHDPSYHPSFVLESKSGVLNETPLLFACRNGFAESARILVMNGADIYATNLEGYNALQLLSIESNNLEMFKESLGIFGMTLILISTL